jgi:hypothetical protein
MRVLEIVSATGYPLRAVLDRESGRVMFYGGREFGDAPRGTRRQSERTPDGQFVAEYLTSDYLSMPTVTLVGGEIMYTLTVESMDAVVKWLRCDAKATYSTASRDGMEFIGGRWVFAGDKGYRVTPDGEMWRVDSYAGSSTRPTSINRLTEDDAHDAAWRIAYGK